MVREHGPGFTAQHVHKVARTDGPTPAPILHEVFQTFVLEEHGKPLPRGRSSCEKIFKAAAKSFLESEGYTAVQLGNPKATVYKAKTGGPSRL